MANKLLVNFISDFVSDEKVRCRILKNEMDGLRDYGMSDIQIATLLSLDRDTILGGIADELLGLGIDLGKVSTESGMGIQAGTGGGALPITGQLAEAAMYQAGQIHIREVQPATVKAGQKVEIKIRGTGFDSKPQVRFTKGTKEVTGKVKAMSCDVDIYQRVTVAVELSEPGDWVVEARNSSQESFDIQNKGKLTATA